MSELLERELEILGVTVLRNEAAALPAAGAPMHLVAVGPHPAGQDDPAATLGGIPDGAPRLVLMHHLDTFPALPAQTTPLTLAGHTHGGQIRIPFLPEWSYLTLAKGGQVTVDDLIDDDGAPGHTVFLTRGVGMSIVPVLLNRPPELTVLNLSGG